VNLFCKLLAQIPFDQLVNIMLSNRLAEDGGFGSQIYRNYALFALLVIYIFNVVDRIILSIVQEQIKIDLELNDFQLGLLGGPAFVVLYTLCQIPIARLAETKNRITIISLGAAAWSFATAACGFVQNFVQLLIARIGVGIGEAACIPPSHSALSDYFPKTQRTTALAIFGLGIPLGTVIAAFGGGLLAKHVDWRWAFIIVGLPGIAAALILKLTVKEPPRENTSIDTPNFLETLKFLFTKKSYVHALIGGSLFAIFTFPYMQFFVSYFIRKFGLPVDQASFLFGLIGGVAAVISMFLGGFLSDKLQTRSPIIVRLISPVSILLTVIFYYVGLGQTSLLAAAILMFIAGAIHFFYFAPMLAISQNVAKSRMRATASAILITSITLIGYGIGPPLVGALADYFSTLNLANAGFDL
jgi:MFS family permease